MQLSNPVFQNIPEMKAQLDRKEHFLGQTFKASCLGQSFHNSKFPSELLELTENSQPPLMQPKHPILQEIS